MMDMDIFQLLYNHLEERHYNNICQNAKQDANYLKATVLENELNAEYEKLNLSDEQQNVIMQWIDAIHAQEAAYTVVAFRMGMQCCFSLLMQLANLQLHKKSAVFQNFSGSVIDGFVNVTEISGIPRLHQVRKTADPVILFNV